MAFLIPLAASAIGAGISAYSQRKRQKKDAKTGRDTRQLSVFSPGQEKYQSQLLQGLGGPTQGSLSYLQNLYSDEPGAFDQFEAPYKRQFEQETVPALANRFAGMGSGNLSSSAFQQALAKEGSGLSERLASLRGELRQGALGHLQNFGQLGLKSPFENVYLGGSPNFGERFGAGIAEYGAKSFDADKLSDIIGKWFSPKTPPIMEEQKNNFTNQTRPRF